MSLKIIVALLIGLIMMAPIVLAEVPPAPTTLTYSQGQFWINYTWAVGTDGSGNSTNGYNVSVVNNSVQYWVNGTASYLNSTLLEDQWSNITVWAFNNTGAGNLSTGNVTQNAQAYDTLAKMPPAPSIISYTQGNFWINFTWGSGTGNTTDGYNVSVINNSVQYWVNGTARYLNSTIGEDQWSNITVRSYNSTSSGTINLTESSKSIQAVDTRMTAPGSFWRGFKLYGSWIDLMGYRGLRNGSIQDITCSSGCSGFSYNATYDAKPSLDTVNASAKLSSVSQLPTNITDGGFDVTFSNGSNNLVAGEYTLVQAKYTGSITALSAYSAQNGSINMSVHNQTAGTYVGSVNISSGVTNTTTGLSYSFVKGAWLNVTISSVTGVNQSTIGVQTVRS